MPVRIRLAFTAAACAAASLAIAAASVVHRGAAPPPDAPSVARAPASASIGEADGVSQRLFELNGTWRFSLDREGKGIEESWWTRRLQGKASLPGTLAGQGIGDPVTLDTPWIGQIVDRSFFTAPEYEAYRKPGAIKVPFWLQPDTYYAGQAWYQTDVEIPKDWAGQRAILTLERPHWQTLVAIDDQVVGTNDSLSTPHEYDLGALAPGSHVLTIRVDNSLVVDIGVNSHSISDHTQGNWNGIVGAMTLEARPPVWIEDLQVFPNVSAKSVRVVGRIGNVSGEAGRGDVTLDVRTSDDPLGGVRGVVHHVEAAWTLAGGWFQQTLSLGEDAPLWDEFTPSMYALEARLPNGATRTVTFGLREVGTAGTQFTINGRKTFLRGTLECAIFPKTGHPPTDDASWERIIRIAKAHGLNHIRFHSWCPPDAAFRAADRLGFYYYVEAGSWANGSTRIGIGLPVDDWVRRETDRILRAYGNHPSFVLMSYGNEPGGRDREYLGPWVETQRARDPRRLYTAAAGWPQIPENQFHVTPDPRVQAWGAGLSSRINAKPPETRTDYREHVAARPVPVVSHEIGQWCVYPNLDEIPKYTGYLKARNFEIFRDRLRAHGLEAQARDFLAASGKLQTLCYKEDIESALRTPGMAGFELLDLHDFPGQGTALVGVLDAFWDSKGYVTPEAYRRFSGPTVPLVRLDRRVFTSSESLTADVEVTHFGAAPVEAAEPRWQLRGEDGRVAASGSLPRTRVPIGSATPLGRLRVPLSALQTPRRYSLVVSVDGGENDWDVWVYPDRVSASPGDVLVTAALDATALARLAAGGRVLLTVPSSQVRNDARAPVALGFSSIFWNTAWTGRQAPTTLGVLVDPKHPAFASFPTEFHSNWQWWYLVTRASAMILDDLPRELRPVVQVIDDWFTARKLGLAFEARVNGGSLMVTSIDLAVAPASPRVSGTDSVPAASDPVVRQFRASVLAYMRSARFEPAVTLTPEQVRALFR